MTLFEDVGSAVDIVSARKHLTDNQILDAISLSQTLSASASINEAYDGSPAMYFRATSSNKAKLYTMFDALTSRGPAEALAVRWPPLPSPLGTVSPRPTLALTGALYRTNLALSAP